MPTRWSLCCDEFLHPCGIGHSICPEEGHVGRSSLDTPDSGPVLVVPGESARILRARDDAGCSITVHNGSVDHRCVLNGWKVQHFL